MCFEALKLQSTALGRENRDDGSSVKKTRAARTRRELNFYGPWLRQRCCHGDWVKSSKTPGLASDESPCPISAYGCHFYEHPRLFSSREITLFSFPWFRLLKLNRGCCTRMPNKSLKNPWPRFPSVTVIVQYGQLPGNQKTKHASEHQALGSTHQSFPGVYAPDNQQSKPIRN